MLFIAEEMPPCIGLREQIVCAGEYDQEMGFRDVNGCAKDCGSGIAGSGNRGYSDVTSVLRLVRKRGRNKNPDGPSGLSGFFVCVCDLT